MLAFVSRLPERLKRITSGNEIISEVDGLRFIAIFAVVVQHLHERFVRYTSIEFSSPVSELGGDFDGNVLAFVATRGFIGVYIFFIISGFILALPFAKRILAGSTDLKLGKYYTRRLTRLEPPYLIWMTVFFISFLFVRNESLVQNWTHYLASITYTHSLIFGGWTPFNPPTWTLEVEVQFYLMAPFLALTFFSIKSRNIRRTILVLFILVLMASQQYFKVFLFPLNLTILPYLQFFLAGFLLTDIYLCDWKKKVSGNLVYDFIAVGSLALAISILDWEYAFFDRVGVALLLFLFFYAVFRAKYVNWFFTNRWIMAVGGMCYTIYLIHLPLAEFFILFTKDVQVTNSYVINMFIQLLIFLPLLFVVCSIAYLLFEKPFMNKDWPVSAFNKLSSQKTRLVFWTLNKK